MTQDRTQTSTRSPRVTTLPDPDINEAHRRVIAHIGPRRLIAAGIKRGNGQLVVKAVA